MANENFTAVSGWSTGAHYIGALALGHLRAANDRNEHTTYLDDFDYIFEQGRNKRLNAQLAEFFYDLIRYEEQNIGFPLFYPAVLTSHRCVFYWDVPASAYTRRRHQPTEEDWSVFRELADINGLYVHQLWPGTVSSKNASAWFYKQMKKERGR